MKSAKMNAQLFRIVLVLCLIALIGLGSAGFYFVQNLLRTKSQEISKLNSEASASEEKLSALSKMKVYLDEHKSSQDKAEHIVAESKKYKYQNDIIDSLSKIAAESGINIVSYTFVEGASAAPTAGTTPAPGPATSPTSPAGNADSATPVSTLKSKSVTAAIKSPVPYKNLITFIRKIEGNSKKMQISNVSISRSAADSKQANSQAVSSDSFLIEVYVR